MLVFVTSRVGYPKPGSTMAPVPIQPQPIRATFFTNVTVALLTQSVIASTVSNLANVKLGKIG